MNKRDRASRILKKGESIEEIEKSLGKGNVMKPWDFITRETFHAFMKAIKIVFACEPLPSHGDMDTIENQLEDYGDYFSEQGNSW